MKKVLFGMIVCTLLLVSCHKDKNSPNNNTKNLSNTPLAKAAYDNNNFGIYKGVFVGSSGSILINIYNDGNLGATLVVDGTTLTFTSNSTITQGQAGTVHFTSGNDSFDFVVDALGNSQAINFNISGHPNPSVHIFKELSNSLVRVYEGTFDGGIFDLVVRSDGSIEGAAKPNGENAFDLNGSIQPNGSVHGAFQDNYNENGTFDGTFSGDDINGTWTQSIKNGHWSGHRTL